MKDSGNAVWNRGQLSNQLRSHLKQYFPAALTVFQVRGAGLDSREARAVLATAPDPATAAKLTKARFQTLLRRAGRQRNIAVWAERLHQAFSREQLHQSPLVEQAMGHQTQALVRQLAAACRAADELAAATAEAFTQHPDSEILASFPGIGPLGEIGDDRPLRQRPRPEVLCRLRTDHHRQRQEFRCAPTKSQNQRLAAAYYVWAFGVLPVPQIKVHYDRCRAAGDKHAAARRNLFNRFLGCLYDCLQTGQTFDLDKAFPPHASHPEPVAA